MSAMISAPSMDFIRTRPYRSAQLALQGVQNVRVFQSVQSAQQGTFQVQREIPVRSAVVTVRPALLLVHVTPVLIIIFSRMTRHVGPCARLISSKQLQCRALKNVRSARRTARLAMT